MGSSYILVPRSPRPIVPALFTAGVVSGTVVDGSAGPVSGAGVGTVEFWDVTDTTLVTTASIDGSGHYFTGMALPNATYHAWIQPPPDWSNGPTEPLFQTVVVSGNVVQNFILQSAVFDDDCSAYTTAQIIGSGAGSFFNIANTSKQVANTQGGVSGGHIVADATGGFSGRQCIRYDWLGVANSGGSYCSVEQGTVNLGLQWANHGTSPVSDLSYPNGEHWISITTRESLSFYPGAASCSGNLSLKFWEFDLGPLNGGGSNGRIGLYLNRTSGGLIYLHADITDRLGNTADTSYSGSGGDYPWTVDGLDHCWTISLTGMGTNFCRVTVYLDGVVILRTKDAATHTSLDIPFFPGQTVGGGSSTNGQLSLFQMGASINNGPEFAMSRYWSRVARYNTRPRLKAA